MEPSVNITGLGLKKGEGFQVYSGYVGLKAFQHMRVSGRLEILGLRVLPETVNPARLEAEGLTVFT